MRWQYIATIVPDKATYSDNLQNLGEAGWEAYAVIPCKKGFNVWLKRPITNNSKGEGI